MIEVNGTGPTIELVNRIANEADQVSGPGREWFDARSKVVSPPDLATRLVGIGR